MKLTCEWTRPDSHMDVIWQVDFAPPSDPSSPVYLASCSTDRQVHLWRFPPDDHLANGKLACSLAEDQHQRTIRTLQFQTLSGGRLLATGSFDGTVCLFRRQQASSTDNETDMDWDETESRELYTYVATLEGHENEVKSVAWSPVAPLLATCSRDKSVWIWDVPTTGAEEELDVQCVAILQEHTQDVKMVKWHPTQEWLVSCSYDETLRLWAEDPSDGEWLCVQTLHLPPLPTTTTKEAIESESTSPPQDLSRTLWSVEFDPSGDRLVAVGDDCSLYLWQRVVDNSSTRPHYDLIYTLRDPVRFHSDAIYSVCWSPELNGVATAGADRCICLIRQLGQADQTLLKVEGAHEGEVNCVRWFHSSLASCSDDQSIKMWTLRSS